MTTALADGNASAYSVAQEPNGDLLVAGSGYLACYNPEGSLDTSFGTDGIVTTDFTGGCGAPTAVAISDSGYILLAGGKSNGSTGREDFAVAELNLDGTPNTNFGTNGEQIIDFPKGGDAWATSVAIQPSDGSILVAGSGELVCLNQDGSMDTGFNGTGIVTTDYAGHVLPCAVAICSNGNVVLWGSHELAEFNPDGTPVSGFGSGGVVTCDFSVGTNQAGLAVQPDGMIVAVGQSAAPSP